MYLNRPRLRFDGIFISKYKIQPNFKSFKNLFFPINNCFCVGKNTYVRQGTTEWTYHQPVHSVVYYRYLRFFPREDRVLYRYGFGQKEILMHIIFLLHFHLQ